ncbi:MAG: DsbA family oxidoreductase [Bacteroidota bacterium]|nr:DsbA family oxidoreductase [Bacteroidota bacterium]
MEQFVQKDDVEIIWKSFLLNPDIKTDPSKNIHEYLSEIKGISLAQAKQMNYQVTQMASEVGLEYNFDTAVIANSFDAHRFSHFAKKYNKQNEAEEALFKSYFTEGKNTADTDTLVQLAEDIGLDGEELRKILESDEYINEVRHDMEEAAEFGISGVPFFVFDRKYAVRGAQDSAVFLQTMDKIMVNG